ncbi:MAG: RNA methyltransferase [Anaerolineales bacterium]|nr:RNA methyltransferase [Anaerolineales bacterium]
MITSVQNPKIKYIRSLVSGSKSRTKEQAFVVEGVRLAEEAVQTGINPLIGIYNAGLSDRGMELINQFRKKEVPIEEVTPEIMSSISDTKTPQGILLVLPFLSPPIPAPMDLIIILDQIRDPGNLGTILRTASAAGVQFIALSPGSVDLYSPKVVRSSMGAIFRIPCQELSWEIIKSLVEENGMTGLLAAADGEEAVFDIDLKKPTAIFIGSEAHGAGDQARKIAEKKVNIPMPGQAESLNAAIATSVFCFEAVRQRHNSGESSRSSNH